jgi:hypothetical protein
MEPGMSERECPAGCGAGQGEDLSYVSSSELKLTPLVLTASKMQEGDQLLLCNACGRVVRRSFDSYILRFRLHSLGTYHPHQGQFEPGRWLQREMERMTMLLPADMPERRNHESEGD